MKKVGELGWEVRSYNTCECQGRVFNFAADDQRKLVVGEVFLGEEVEVRRVGTGVKCKCSSSRFFSCCPLGDKVLVMAGEQYATEFFCALVSIDPGELTQESIHIEEKKVSGWESYGLGPVLVQISEDRVWASFDLSDEIWIGKLKGDELVMTKHPDQLPVEEGFGALPLRFPDGKFLAAGGLPSSTDITIITPGEHFSFEKIGDIPGEERDSVSTILIKERFLVGFGGWDDDDVDGMWIFDLKTHKASLVTNEGKWHPGGPWPFMAVKDNILYIIGGYNSTNAHSITLQHLSELIQDLDLQGAFQRTLGLDLRRYPADREEDRELRGMRDLGGCFPDFFAHNTIDHQGRVFHFSQREGKLCVTEVFFGPRVKTRTVNTGIDCKTGDDDYILCCSLGDKILVIPRQVRARGTSCALVTIDPGELTTESVHVEEKQVVMRRKSETIEFLTRISETEVQASSSVSDEIWIGKLQQTRLVMRKRTARLAAKCGFGSHPLRLPDGRFLVTGEWLPSTTITAVTPGKRFPFEKIGDMPGEGRRDVSMILIGERFVVGFGGCHSDYVDDMWIFDLKTHKVSPVKKEGEWHPGGPRPILVVQDKELYVIGGGATTAAHCLSFAALVRLIQHDGVRYAFCFCLGFPIHPSKALKRSTLKQYSSPSL